MLIYTIRPLIVHWSMSIDPLHFPGDPLCLETVGGLFLQLGLDFLLNEKRLEWGGAFPSCANTWSPGKAPTLLKMLESL